MLNFYSQNNLQIHFLLLILSNFDFFFYIILKLKCILIIIKKKQNYIKFIIKNSFVNHVGYKF